MQRRKLGKSELEVSSLVFGENVVGWTVDEPISFRLLDAFFTAGGNFIDSADVYSILYALDEVARDLHSTPSKVSLAWLMARPSITAPVASATSLEQLRDLIDATELKLATPTIERLNNASAYVEAAAG